MMMRAIPMAEKTFPAPPRFFPVMPVSPPGCVMAAFASAVVVLMPRLLSHQHDVRQPCAPDVWWGCHR